MFIFYTHSASVICSVHILYISRLNYNSQEIKCIFKLSETCQNQTLNKLESCINRTKYSPNVVLINQTLVYSEQNNWSQDALVVQAYPKTFGHLSRNSSKRLDCNISPSQQKPLKHKENLSVLWWFGWLPLWYLFYNENFQSLVNFGSVCIWIWTIVLIHI